MEADRVGEDPRDGDTVERGRAVGVGGHDREGDSEVQERDEEDADQRGARDVALRVPELGRQVRDRLPAEEGEEEQDGGAADRSPALRHERREVREPQVGERGQAGREQDERDAGGEDELEPAAHAQAA